MKRVLHAGLSIIHIVTSHIQRRYSIHWGPGILHLQARRFAVGGGAGCVCGVHVAVTLILSLFPKHDFRRGPCEGRMCLGWLGSQCAMFLSPWVTGHRVLIECNKNKMNPLPRWFWPLRAAAHGAYRPEVVVCTHTPAQRHPSCIHASPHVTSGNPHPSRPVPTRPHPFPPLPTPPLAFLRPRDLRDPRATRQGRVRSDEFTRGCSQIEPVRVHYLVEAAVSKQ